MTVAGKLLKDFEGNPVQLYKRAEVLSRGGEIDEEYETESFYFADGSELLLIGSTWLIHTAPPEHDGTYMITSHLRGTAEPAYWDGEVWIIEDHLATINLRHLFVTNWS